MSEFAVDTTVKAVAAANGYEVISYTSVRIDPGAQLPAAFMRLQPDRDRLRKFLENGGELEGVTLEPAYLIRKKAREEAREA